MDLLQPLFIVGDLNKDIIVYIGVALKQVMNNYQLQNYDEKPTESLTVV